ncbi:uncharacterized protein LOC114861383 isoform X3 [Betta splendens]|uniref:Uncharacterized protein LOC114861383 isoform X3 n=1 Tax=Betta splendens TaxID=158456 RepID=A0A6P7NDX8_BETSP|nr:uncharacterized protein LOC114861383 isoform X3 [Betta splendens]
MGPGALWVSVVVVCLLGAARCSPDEKETCPCPDIPLRPDTLPPPQGCFPVGHRFRYKCVEGKVRKAGTSDLTKCSQSKGKVSWTDANLECIDDPKRPKPTQSELTSAHTPSPHDIMTTIISSTISSTSTQMTPSKSFSPSELTNSTESTTASHSQETITTALTDRTTSASATTGASISTAHAPRYAGKEAAAGISCVSLVIICALIGFSLYFVRRRKRQNLSQEKPEEQVAINCINGLPE